MNTTGPTVLRVEGLEKSFGPTRALAGVTLELRRGEVHALLGGNGSGKSTFIKALAGVQPADRGVIITGETAVAASDMTPALARETGLRFVHQSHSTFADLTVAENLEIGDGYGVGALARVPRRALHRRAAEVLDRFHIKARPETRLGDLGAAMQAMVAIARALMGQEQATGHVLVLDEPTASLPAADVTELLDSLTRLAASGHTILYVTHRLNEVLQVADRATVFRDGLVAAELERAEITHSVLVEKIMGRQVEAILEEPTANASTEVMLDVQGLVGGPIGDATFQVRAGEIVGIAGILGSGRSSLLRMVFGDLPTKSGTIRVGGDTLSVTGPGDAMAAGLALVPEDRAAEAAFAEMSVIDNLGICATRGYFRRGRYHHRRERRDAQTLVDQFFIKTPSVTAPISTLSGGNQQKVILGRWMRRKPRLLLLDEPTQGVDVAARAEIWTLVRRATSEGAAVLVVSSDFEELPRVCDRVLVLRGGRITNEVAGTALTEHAITQLAMIDEVA